MAVGIMVTPVISRTQWAFSAVMPQPDTPGENIRAMVETAKQYG